MSGENNTPPSYHYAGWHLVCPRCGKGHVYQGLLTVAETCSVCDFPLRAHDAGDGPAFFAMFISCIFVSIIALLLDAYLPIPLWAHVLIWTPFTVGISVWMLRIFKSYLIALQYRYRATDFHS